MAAPLVKSRGAGLSISAMQVLESRPVGGALVNIPSRTLSYPPRYIWNRTLFGWVGGLLVRTGTDACIIKRTAGAYKYTYRSKVSQLEPQ